MEAVWVALIAAVVAPAVLSVLTNRHRRAERLEDYARQDAVADRLTRRQDAVAEQAREAAALLLAAQKAGVERTDEVARLAAESEARLAAKLEVIDTQGKIIHALVNRKLTDVTQQALLATLALLPHLEAAIARMHALGIEPSEMDLKRLADTKRSINELRANLEQRAETQAEVDAQAEEASE